MAKKSYYNEFLMNFFLKEKMKIREDKRMVKLVFFVFFKIVPFGLTLKSLAHSLFGAWSFL